MRSYNKLLAFDVSQDFVRSCQPFWIIPDSKVHGANMGSIWGRQDPGGPHVGPMNFAIWDVFRLAKAIFEISNVQRNSKFHWGTVLMIHLAIIHDDIIKWRHFPCYRAFVRGIHRSPVNSPYKGQWRRALMFSLICAWINSWVNNREAGYLRSHRAHYDIIVMDIGLDHQSVKNQLPPPMKTKFMDAYMGHQASMS